MFLVAMFDRVDSERIVRYMGSCEDMDTVLKWYRSHSKLTPAREKDFWKLWRQKGSIEEKWVRFGQHSMYGVHWVSEWAPDAFDGELAMARQRRRESRLKQKD